jgi:hypothetical protein
MPERVSQCNDNLHKLLQEDADKAARMKEGLTLSFRLEVEVDNFLYRF